MRLGKRSAAVAIAAVAALLATSGSPAVGSTQVKSAKKSMPNLTVKMSGKNSLKVSVPPHLTAGRVELTLIAGKGEQAFSVLRLHGSYTISDFASDWATYAAAQEQPTADALKALNRAVKHITFMGGLDSGNGHKTVTGTVVLAKAADYYVVNDNEGPNFKAPVVKLPVAGPVAARHAPAAAATVKATTSDRFRGSTNLPASGTIKFENVAKASPHFVSMIHLKDGTTRKQVIKALQSPGPPPFEHGSVGADIISPGHAMTLTYTLPAGDYAEVCFFPDLKTGMPHAFMGMVRIVHLS
jgi:hypothetical protein